MSFYWRVACESCGESIDIRSGYSGLKVSVGEEPLPLAPKGPFTEFLEKHEYHETTLKGIG